ncbi:MAG: hypothetical protein ACFCD0_23990 [Gemmataceae bacterium]
MLEPETGHPPRVTNATPDNMPLAEKQAIRAVLNNINNTDICIFHAAEYAC